MSGDNGNPWFRFGLPLGSSLVLVAFLDTGMNFFVAWMDLGGLIVYHISDSEHEMDPMSIIWIIIVVTWIFANLGLLWYGGIAKGHLTMILAWIATTSVCSMIVLGMWFYELRLTWGQWRNFFTEIYSLLTFLLSNGYIIYIGIQCAQEFKQNNQLEPIGQGFTHIVKFYRDDPTLAAKVLLISELVIIGEYFFTRQMMVLMLETDIGSGHEGDSSAAIIAEEYVLRAIRVLVTSAGLYFIVMGKLAPLKYWGLAYLGTIILSFCIFIYLLIMWNAEHPFFTVGYYLMFVISLVYRGGILFTCMKVIQPYISSNSFLNLQES